MRDMIFCIKRFKRRWLLATCEGGLGPRGGSGLLPFRELLNCTAWAVDDDSWGLCRGISIRAFYYGSIEASLFFNLGLAAMQ